MITGAIDGELQQWEPHKSPKNKSLPLVLLQSSSTSIRPRKRLTLIATNSDGTYAVTANVRQRFATYWNVLAKKTCRLDPASPMSLDDTHEIVCVDMCSDGSRVITGDNAGSLHLWSVVDNLGSLMHTMNAHSQGVTCVAMSESGQLALSACQNRGQFLSLSLSLSPHFLFDITH